MHAQAIIDRLGIRYRAWAVGQQYGKCPRCKGNFSLKIEASGHAMWKCWKCEFSGNTAKLGRELRQELGIQEQAEDPGFQRRVDRRRGGEIHRTRRPVGESTKAAQIEPTAPTPGDEPEHIPYTDAHARFWDSCLPITADCPIGRYLAKRDCPIPLAAADLRWKPDFRYNNPRIDWRGPCMIGRITNVLTGEPQSFHFTWVQPDGGGKAPIEKPRLLAYGMTKGGGCIRLFDDADLGEWLMVGEGIETCLAAQGACSMRPAWSLIDAGNLAAMPVVPGIRKLVILSDHDKVNPNTGKRAGLAAADALFDRWIRVPSVSRVLIVYPPEGQDINDMLRQQRRCAA